MLPSLLVLFMLNPWKGHFCVQISHEFFNRKLCYWGLQFYLGWLGLLPFHRKMSMHLVILLTWTQDSFDNIWQNLFDQNLNLPNPQSAFVPVSFYNHVLWPAPNLLSSACWYLIGCHSEGCRLPWTMITMYL